MIGTAYVSQVRDLARGFLVFNWSLKALSPFLHSSTFINNTNCAFFRINQLKDGYSTGNVSSTKSTPEPLTQFQQIADLVFLSLLSFG